MGYDNLTAWRELVKRQIPNIAKAQKIDMQNLRWYAAFHDKETNPHVHIVAYSIDESESYLTNKGIEQIRSGFANDIYQDELHHLYARQTEVRDLLKKESTEMMQQLSAKVESNPLFEPELCQMIQLCRKQLQEFKGKKVYEYLKPEIKRTVDRIFEMLASNESIQKMYALWCEMEQQKHDVYSSAKITPPSLIDNPNFKSVKNMIIRAVLEMQAELVLYEIKMESDDAIEVETPEPLIKAENEKLEQDSDNSDQGENLLLASTILGLLINISHMIEDDYIRNQKKLQTKIDSKLQLMIRKHKQELGIKDEYGQQYFS